MKEEHLNRISRYVIEKFQQDSPAFLYYHNLSHTQSVVQHIQEIGGYYRLDAERLGNLSAAGWFHDIGHLYTVPEEHEYRSVAIMRECLKDRCDEETTGVIERLILATRMPSHPASLDEEIICDADTYHFGTDAFAYTDKQVKKEMESRTGAVFTAWTERALHLLENHRFFTGYCREKLEAGKRANIAYLQSQLVKPG